MMESILIDYLSAKNDDPIYQFVKIHLTPKNLAKYVYGCKHPTLSIITKMRSQMIKEYHRSSHINGDYTKKILKDKKGRTWWIWPADNGGLFCTRARQISSIDIPIVIPDEHGITMIPKEMME